MSNRVQKTGRGEQILVVDDSRETVRHLAETLLPSFGFRSTYALDGRSALDKIRLDKPDLVILDLNLPMMTGIDVLQALALEQQRPPVILMTGGGSEKSAIEAFRLGVKDYLVKPFTIEEMLGTIQRTLYPGESHGDPLLPEDDQLAAAQNEVRRQQELMAKLLHLSRTLTSLNDLNTLVDRALRATLTQTDAEHSFIWLAGSDSAHHQTYTLSLDQNQVRQQNDGGDDPYRQRVLAGGSPLRITNFSDGLDIGRPRKARALLYIPLHGRSAPIGVLGVINDHDPHAFSQYDELLLDAVASYVSIALANALTLRHAYSSHAGEMQRARRLADLNRQLVQASPQTVIESALRCVRDQWAIEACSVWAVDQATHSVRFLTNNGPGGDALSDMTLTLGDGFVGYVGETGRWFYSNAVPNHPRHYSALDRATGMQTFSILCVPLRYHDAVLGVLQLVNRTDGDFDETDVELALAYAAPLALALHLLRTEHAQPT